MYNDTAFLLQMSAGELIGVRSVVLRERTIYVRPWQRFVYRTNSYSTHNFSVYVTKYGQPMSGAIVHLNQSNLHSDSITKYVTNVCPCERCPFHACIRCPSDGVKFANDLPTTVDGLATFELHINKVEEPRKTVSNATMSIHFDVPGQVYLYSYTVNDQFPVDVMAPNLLSIKVYSDITYPNTEGITWVDHVLPIFEQYAQLYPVMKPIVNMANYTDVKLKKDPLVYVLSLPQSHPSHMPVTRDLSDTKREMILKWLNNGCRYSSTHMDGPPPALPLCKPSLETKMEFDEEVPNKFKLPESCRLGHQSNEYPVNELYSSFAVARTDYDADDDSKGGCMNVNWQKMKEELRKRKPTITDLHCLLQTAIRLEFSTVPPYLTALYSIIDGCNVEVQRVILSICMQEMLHMAQVANLLIALGGHPIINSRTFTPTYPGPLPGGVFPRLTVHLRKATIVQIRDAFMAIEFPTETAVDVEPPQYHNHTIGSFYRGINKTLNDLYKDKGEDIFCKECFVNEVSWPKHNSSFPGTLHNVTDITSAHKAFDEITEQGEGAGPFDPTSGLGDQLAHYYKFEEIVCGNKLKENSTGGYQFNGEPIEFDESGVYPMRDDPKTAEFSPDTNAGHFSRVFNENYRHLLNVLHMAFNKQPWVIDEAVTLMQSLKVHAIKLMRTPIDGSTTETAGPTWEYE